MLRIQRLKQKNWCCSIDKNDFVQTKTLATHTCSYPNASCHSTFSSYLALIFTNNSVQQVSCQQYQCKQQITQNHFKLHQISQVPLLNLQSIKNKHLTGSDQILGESNVNTEIVAKSHIKQRHAGILQNYKQILVWCGSCIPANGTVNVHSQDFYRKMFTSQLGFSPLQNKKKVV